MTRRLAVGALVAAAVLSACSHSSSLATDRYYDPAGFFSAELPSANQLVVMPTQTLSPSLDLLSGVVALPQTASPSPNSAFSGGIVPTTTQQDTALYAVSAVQAKKVSSVGALATQLLEQTVHPHLVGQQRVIVDGLPGLLVVTDHHDDQGNPYYSDASAFFLYQGVGFWVRELYSFGQWNQRKSQFRQVMRSFRPGVPAGVVAVPLSQPGVSIESKLVWPLG